jgi:2C-methyl-D-erythritol 2,4-cyclodiphosphate synthase
LWNNKQHVDILIWSQQVLMKMLKQMGLNFLASCLEVGRSRISRFTAKNIEMLCFASRSNWMSSS